MPASKQSLSCWVISDGRRGIENQALGLAEALERQSSHTLNISTHRIENGSIFRGLPPHAQSLLKPKPQRYGLPYEKPDWVIGCGRQAIAPLMTIKKHWRSDVFTIYVQKPYVSPRHFDYIIAPEHDALSALNVISMIGSPNRVTDERLAQAKQDFQAELAQYPAPRATLLIGGPSNTHTLSKEDHEAHMKAATDLLKAGQSLLISTSRRTPGWAKEGYDKLAQEHDNIWLHTGDGRNPYMAFLAAANTLLVTEDSTNMLTEACATGRPIFRLPMSGRPGKFAKLYDSLSTRCYVRQFDGNMTAELYTPLYETQRVAEKLWTAYLNR